MPPPTLKYSILDQCVRLSAFVFVVCMFTSCAKKNDDVQSVSGTPGNAAPATATDIRSVTPKTVASDADLQSAQRLPDVPLKNLYPSLLNRAEAGDMEAKRQLFLVLNECRVAMQPDRSLDYSNSQVSPEILKASGRTREQFLIDQQLRALTYTEEKLKECEGVPGDAQKEAARWLKEAAKAGDTYARLAYYNYLDLIVGDQQEQATSPEEIQKFNEDSFRYIKSVADTSNADGLFTLGTAYERGIITPRDPIRAYAYKKAAGELMPINRNDQILYVMAQSMTPNEIRKANQLASSLTQTSKE